MLEVGRMEGDGETDAAESVCVCVCVATPIFTALPRTLLAS